MVGLERTFVEFLMPVLILRTQKNALQWTKNPAGSEDQSNTPVASSTASAGAEGAEQESGDSTEAASGENDGVWKFSHFFTAY